MDKATLYYKKGCALGFSGSCKILEVVGKKSDNLQDDAQNDTQDDTQ
ncbi:hypothetical protein HpHA303_14810 [Helicobacter pylori]